MELNSTGVLWVSLIGLLFISLPYLYYLLKSRNQEKTSTETFQEFTNSRKLVLGKIQKWRNHYILGLDLDQNILVYCRYGYYPQQMHINLDEVDHTTIDARYEEVNVGKSKMKKLGYLDILLHFKDQSKPPKSLTIFDEGQIRNVVDEPFIAQNWVWIINQQIKSAADRSSFRLAM